MHQYELDLILHKRRQLRKLLFARQRVKQLERSLRGELAQPEDPPFVPHFLRVQVTTVIATAAAPAGPLARDEAAVLVTKAMNSWGRRAAREEPAARRLHLIEGSGARSPSPAELPHQPYR